MTRSSENQQKSPATDVGSLSSMSLKTRPDRPTKSSTLSNEPVIPSKALQSVVGEWVGDGGHGQESLKDARREPENAVG